MTVPLRTRVLLLTAAYVLFYLALDGFAVFEMGAYLWGRDDVASPRLYAGLYLGAYAIGLLGLVMLHAHAQPIIRYGAYAIAAVTGTAHLAFASINGHGFGITEATLLWEEVEFVPGALVFFAGNWLPAAAGIVVVLAALEWGWRRAPRGRFPAIALLVGILVPGLSFYSMLTRSDARLDQFPIPFRVAALSLYAFNNQVVWLGTRDAPAIAPTREPLAPHIVFIVDESIRGDWLGVNGADVATTPFLSSGPDGFFNYGVASSIANLSSPSNIILQSGLRPDQLPDTELRSMKNPNVFQYMKAAGFATFLIDAQHGFGRPPNFMTEADVAALDGHVLVRETEDDFEQWEADLLVLPALSEIIESHDRTFSYVLKIGAHFPYSVRFPPDQAHFGIDSLPAGEYDDDQATIVAEYANTLRWTVDDFTRALVARLSETERDVLVIYTADHAQSLFEPRKADSRRIRGHGHSPHPPAFQVRVPLFLFALGDATRAAVTDLYARDLRDRISAFELFPSLLEMAGYDGEDIASRYYHSIFDSGADRSRRVFVSGNHFGADGPLYRDAPYRSSFGLNDFD